MLHLYDIQEQIMFIADISEIGWNHMKQDTHLTPKEGVGRSNRLGDAN
jgi:hypothetical protein